MTGHGGDEFLKFQDNEEISSFDLADAFQQMWEKRRYNEILFMVDTCQANSMYTRLYSPHIVAAGSSNVGEDSFSHHGDHDLGVHVIDRWTYYCLEVLEKVTIESSNTLQEFVIFFHIILFYSILLYSILSFFIFSFFIFYFYFFCYYCLFKFVYFSNVY